MYKFSHTYPLEYRPFRHYFDIFLQKSKNIRKIFEKQSIQTKKDVL